MTIERAIRSAVDTGEVIIGSRESLKMVLNKEAKLIVVASNCPKDVARDLEHYAGLSNTPILRFKGSSMELGSVCGKPFTISMLSIIKAGDSKIFELARRGHGNS